MLLCCHHQLLIQGKVTLYLGLALKQVWFSAENWETVNTWCLLATSFPYCFLSFSPGDLYPLLKSVWYFIYSYLRSCKWNHICPPHSLLKLKTCWDNTILGVLSSNVQAITLKVSFTFSLFNCNFQLKKLFLCRCILANSHSCNSTHSYIFMELIPQAT